MAEPTLVETKHITLTGLLLILLGILSMVAPVVAGTALIICIGGILFLAGMTLLLQGFQDNTREDKWLSIILGLITIVASALVIAHPLLGLSFLTILLMSYFIADGVWKIFVSFKLHHLSNWSWVLISGLLSLLLGVLIWSQWPLSGVWAVGVLIGVNLCITGITMMALASNIRALRKV